MILFLQRNAAKLLKHLKFRCLVLICLLSIVFLSCLVLPGYADNGLQMKVRGGFAGYAHSGSFAPVQVTVENNGPTIAAYLEISTLSGAKQVLYRKLVALPAGSKKALDMYIPVNAGQDYTVKLAAEAANKLLAESSLRIRCMEDGLLVGVLGQNGDSLEHLEALRLPRSDKGVGVACLQAENLPVNGLLLDSISMLVFCDYPLTRLPEQKSGAIKEWVNRGGMLILAGQYSSFSVFTGDDSNNGLVGENVKELVLDDHVLYHRPLGKGNIYYLPGYDTAVGVNEIRLWQYLLNQADSSPPALSNYLNEADNTLGLALSTMPASDLPSIGWLTGIYFVYIMILGPGAYLVLKRFDRREWGWALVPLLAVLLFSFTYFYGFKGKGWDAYTSIISLVRLDGNNDYVRVNSFQGVFAPTWKDYTIDLPGESLVSLMPVDIGSYGSGMSGGDAKEPPIVAVIKQGNNTGVKFDETTRWSVRCIRSEALLHQPGYISSNLQMEKAKVSGTIQNLTGFDLNDCTVISAYNYQYIGRLEAGATTLIDFRPYLQGQKGAALQTFQRMENNYPVNWPRQDRNIGLRDKEIKQNLTAMIARSYDFMDGKILLVGYSNEALKGTYIEHKKEKRYAATAFAVPLTVDINNTDEVHVAPGIVNARLVSTEGLPGPLDEWGYNLNNSQLTMQIDLPCSPQDYSIDEVRIFVPGIDYRMQEGVSIKVYNRMSGSWDEVGCNPAGSLLGNGGQYMNENGSMLIKVAKTAGSNLDKALYFPGLTVGFTGSYMSAETETD